MVNTLLLVVNFSCGFGSGWYNISEVHTGAIEVGRKEDIKAIIDKAKATFPMIKKWYDESLHQQEISHKLKVEIKNYLENLRSVLDYLASEINERYCIKKTKAYFPMSCEDATAYSLFMKRHFPGLKDNNKSLYNLLESYQPYAPKASSTLSSFGVLVNKNKHEELSPQTRGEKRGLKLDFRGGGGITLPPGAHIAGTGRIISGGSTISLDGGTISGDSPLSKVPNGITQTVIVWVSFRFDCINEEVLPFLDKILATVQKISDDLMKILWS